jgi:type IV pilus assembly protein PilB
MALERPSVFDAPVDDRLRAIADAVEKLHDKPPVRMEGSANSEVVPTDGPEWATRRTARTERSRQLGQMLVERRAVTADQLAHAVGKQRTSGRRVGETLVEMGVLSRGTLAEALAAHFELPYVDLEHWVPDAVLTAMIPEECAQRYQALAVERWDRKILVAMADPNDVFALDDLRVLTRREIVPAFCDSEQLIKQIDRAYQHSEIESSLEDAGFEMAPETLVSEDDTVEDGPVVRLVNVLLDQAIADRASDLHVEPTSTHVRIRLRIDGVLHDASDLPLNVLRPLVSRLKVVSGLDIAQSRIAQDGRFTLNVNSRLVDVRVTTIPTAAGESVVLRLLDPERGVLELAGLGLTDEELARLLPTFHAPQGAVFVTGPTGSGKTSTLYAFMSEANSVAKSIVSVEDPVEYRVDGIKQIQINSRAGVTFPSALRAVLRADPDVIFIGEVRDAETAHIAADASITGHLVLSTLHTTRAASAPMRLIDMGVEPYLVASAMSCVAAQRLARKLCTRCARDHDRADFDVLRDLGANDADLDYATVRYATGCPACRRTGYHGRMPVFEIMPVTEEISRAIVERSGVHEIERIAIEQGMDTLRKAALRRVLSGELSIDEMLRVIA